MPRLRQISRAEAPNEFVLRAYNTMFGPDRDPVAEPGTATGTPGNWWTVFANSPEVFHHAVAGFSLYQKSAERLNPHATLSRALRLEYDDRDEPVQEIAAPEGAESRDIGADLAGAGER